MATKACIVFFLLLLAGCSGVPSSPDLSSPCQTKGQNSWECQIYRYDKVGIQ